MIDFIVDHSEAELLSDALWSLGVVAIEEREYSDASLVLRTSMGNDPQHAVDIIAERFPTVRVSHVEISKAVADTWRQHVSPTWVNNDVALVPAWIPAPESCTPIFIEPFDTFGLGNHPTTVLALRLALKHVPPQCTVFDLGCGTGVLAIGVAKLLNCKAHVTDIAPNSQQIVQHNCDINSVDGITWSENIAGTHNHAVLANILAPVLIELSDSIQKALATDGVVILSGMRTEQVDGVVKHFTTCTQIDADTLEGWTAVVLKKN